MIHYKNSNGYETWSEYDNDGNKIHVKDSDGVEEWYEYDKNNNKIHYKNSNGDEKWYKYDAKGNMIRCKDNEFEVLYSYKYNSYGRITTRLGYKYLDQETFDKINKESMIFNRLFKDM